MSLLVVSCASAPPRPVRSEFEDIPVPKGMAYQADDSTVIETPAVKAGRQVYRGRIEVDSLASAIRSTLEANGWRSVSNTTNARHGTTQVYEKGGTSLQVLLWEGMWYTYAEYTTARVLQLPK
ncbi:MAG TPA: hypothetical protein VGU22_18070 [Methylomirabilota bacterium]|nr:hypothetical protein [Methylomirabilota bacterium]